MPVPSTIADLSTTPGSNSPAGSESPNILDDYMRTAFAFIKQLDGAKASDSAVVKLSGNQTIADTKTFSSPIAGSVTGNAATATALQTARAIGGVSFDGTANINLPGVNTAGNQDTSGNAATATTDNQHFGIGQTWLDVSFYRAPGTNYTNTTGRPIMVAVTSAAGTSVSVIGYVSGSEIMRQVLQVGGSVFNASASFVVPPGATYSVTASPSISNWRELR